MESYLSVREAAFVLPETAARETYLEAGALSLRAAVVIWIFSWRLWWLLLSVGSLASVSRW